MKKNNLDEVFKQAQELLQDKENLFDTVMDAIGDLISIQDLNMRIAYQNKAMKRVMGVHEGEYCYKIYEKRDEICEGCPVIKAFKTGIVAKSLRVGILPDGTPNRFENVAAALRNKKGKIVAGVEVCRDVEEKEGALEDLERFGKLAVGRELKMMDLEKEIEELKKELEKHKGREQ